jgi:hypothetical protein
LGIGQQQETGVAILVNPCGKVKNMSGWRETEWTELLIMTMGDLEGRRVLFIKIYAQSLGASRVKFFTKLCAAELERNTGMDPVARADLGPQ